MLPALLLMFSVTVPIAPNSTVPSNSTIPSSNSTSNSTSDPIIVICPREWLSNESCVVATNETFSEVDSLTLTSDSYSDESQCTRAHFSLYLCLSRSVSSLSFRDEIEELLDDEDY